MAFLRSVLPPTTDPAFFHYLQSLDCSDVTLRSVPEGTVVFARVNSRPHSQRGDLRLHASHLDLFAGASDGGGGSSGGGAAAGNQPTVSGQLRQVTTPVLRFLGVVSVKIFGNTPS